MKPVLQVVVSVPEWDDDGHFLFGSAVRRSVLPSFSHVRVFSLHPLQGYLRAEFDEKTPDCGAKRESIRSYERSYETEFILVLLC